MSQITISGAASGLDTASLINQLVSVQTNQQNLLKGQQSSAQQRTDAYTALSTALTALSSTAATLAKTSAWKGSTATSSSTSVTATAAGTASGSLTFDVTGVAAAHSLITTSALASLGDVAATGPVTLTSSSGAETQIDVGGGTLSEVVSAINKSGAGVTASAVRTGSAGYRLQLTARTTGAATAFTASGLDGFDGTSVLAQGSDAQVTVGSDPATAYSVSSTTNTFKDLVPGVSFTVSAKQTGVTVAAAVDGSSVADTIGSLVQQANTILSGIATKSAYNFDTKTSGVFTGDGAVRLLQQNLLTSVSLSGAPGVDVTRDGALTFDRQKFLDAFAADPAGVAQSFGGKAALTPAAGATSSSVALTTALSSARAGSYDVRVTSAPAREQWSLDTGGDLSGQAITLTRGSTTVSYQWAAGQSTSEVAAALNTQLSTSGFGVGVTVNGGTMVFTADSAGSAQGFTVGSDSQAGTQVTAGADVQGTIDGQTASGLGSVLSLPTGTGGAVGLSLAVTTTAADLAATGGSLGRVAFTPGLAQRLVTLIGDANGSTGTITTAQTGATARVKQLQTQIDAWDSRLTSYRQTLTTQFTAMETAMSKLKSSMSALSSLTSGTTSSSSSSGTLSTG